MASGGEADVVVVGAGAFGASVAFHLAARGESKVVLVDRFGAASQTSPRAAGLTQQIRASELLTRISVRSCEKIVRFTEETGEPMTCFVSGSLKLARLPQHVTQLEEEVQRAGRYGVRLAALDPGAIPGLCPWVSPQGVLGATYNPDDLYLDPVQIPRGYARAAVARGARLLEHSPVRRLLVANGRIDGVALDGAEIRAPVVVDAAGAWSRAVAGAVEGEGGGADARPAVVPTRHQLLISEPLDGVRPEQPIVRVVDANVYVRPDGGGLLLGGYEADPVQVDGERLGDDFQIAHLELDLAVLRRLADSVREQVPLLQEVFARGAIREHRGGLPTMSPDARFLLGESGALPGLYIASGCNVGGLSTAPALGEALAEQIATGRASIGDLAPLAPDRFGALDEATLRAATLLEYAYQYWGTKPEGSQRGVPKGI
jgi:glycine/D-amino acid oxidase-like deaminating enzyme